MKGKTLVIGILLFVLIVVGGIYFFMMSTINKIKEENDLANAPVLVVMQDDIHPFIQLK